MINIAIVLCMAIGLWQLAIDSKAWPVWAVVILFLVFCKLTSRHKQ